MGRVLSPAFLERRWQKGQSGNPSGHVAEYGEVLRLARLCSIRALERLVELMESPDERVAAVAANAVLDRAFGKPRPMREREEETLEERIASMSPEQRTARLAELAFKLRMEMAPIVEADVE